MAAPIDGNAFGCHVCRTVSKSLKRCKSCRNTLYCSRKCQIQDWPAHKQQCAQSSKTGIKEEEEVTGSLPSSEENPPCHYTVQLTETLGGQAEIPMNPTQENHRSHTLSSTEDQRSGVGNQCGTTADSFVRTESDGSTTAESDLRDPVTITVKCNKSKHHMLLDRQAPSGADIMSQIACTVHIPASHLKLIHRGKLVTPDTVRDCLRDRAVFQAIGEVAESEEGLRPKDIDIVMDRIKVDRNTAIRALRATGDVVDAILHIGNR